MTRILLMSLLGIIASFSLSACSADDGVAWGSLDDEAQALLAPLKGRWDQLPAERRERLKTGAMRWSQLTPEQQERARDNLARWKQLTPQRRE